MRSRKLFSLFLGLAVMCCFLFVWAGCSDDDSTPTTTSFTQGDPEDADYQLVMDQIEVFVDSSLSNIKSGFNSTNLLPTDTLVDPIHYGPIDPDKDSTSAVYVNGWHVVYIARVEDQYRTAMRDSIQFRDTYGDPQQTVNNLAAMTFRHQWSYSVENTTIDYFMAHGDLNVVFTELNTAEAIVNGSNTFQYFAKAYSSNPEFYPDMTRDFTFESTLTNVHITQGISGWTHSCPCTGTITGSVEMVAQEGTDDPVTTSWTFTLIFEDGTMTATVHQGSIYWTSTVDVCYISG